MSDESNSGPAIERLLEKSLQHLETRWEYFSLTVTEKISGAAAALTGVLIIVVFALIVLFFFSIGFAVWLGDYLGDRAGGFALAGLVFVPIAIGAYLWVPSLVRSKVINSILEDEDTDNES